MVRDTNLIKQWKVSNFFTFSAYKVIVDIFHLFSVISASSFFDILISRSAFLSVIMTRFDRTPLLPEMLANILAHQREEVFQHGTPARDAGIRRHVHKKNDRNMNKAIALGQDPDSDVSMVRTRVRHYLLRNFQDQFVADEEDVRRREIRVPLTQDQTSWSFKKA